MIFFLGLLWAEEPAKVPIADQKVIHYLLDTGSTSDNGSVKKSSESFELPEKLQSEIEEQAKPPVQNTPSQPFPELGAPWWWGLLFGALLLGGLRLFIGKQKKTLGSIKVHSRSFFGHDGSIAVVEVKDAEDNAEADKERRELIEAKNQAESLIHSTEKSMEDHSDKVDPTTIEAIELAISALKDDLETENAGKIKSGIQNVTDAAMKLGEAIYKANQENEDDTAPFDASDNAAANADDDILDADFEDLGDEKN